jgi:hypothetical protein
LRPHVSLWTALFGVASLLGLAWFFFYSSRMPSPARRVSAEALPLAEDGPVLAEGVLRGSLSRPYPRGASVLPEGREDKRVLVPLTGRDWRPGEPIPALLVTFDAPGGLDREVSLPVVKVGAAEGDLGAGFSLAPSAALLEAQGVGLPGWVTALFGGAALFLLFLGVRAAFRSGR